MKSLVIFVLLIGSLGCRTIQGEYTETFAPPGGWATYHFHKNGTFEYESRYDVGGQYGSGHYKIRLGRLVMKFTDSCTEPYVSASWCISRRDSLDTTRNFTVVLLDENKEPLPFGIVRYNTEDDTSNTGVVADVEGVTKLQFPKSVDSVRIKIRYPVYAAFEKSFEVEKYDSVKIQLLPDPHWIQTPVDSGSVWKYRYDKIDSKTIRLTEHRVDEEVTDTYKIKRVRHRLRHTLKRE